ncbi:PDZ domain-containing protein GIPC3 isoform X1 [Folsomia candida]|uniref:PDZ domain-containing protein GIPC1 n=1 Tax=Folsomia candida TaxID=158441 RepID=A0A226E088_FOLCA|nr:PDZ domain-containing protein GIPC3 isoform X1 [Folsomia candida]XP_035710165.1 PDZ domain-containing protein GIPC3 isoform X1 [Folsomia candida]OXA50710.1 PDZ domain-containing protein GIPC1 [Folsomia candida]
MFRKNKHQQSNGSAPVPPPRGNTMPPKEQNGKPTRKDKSLSKEKPPVENEDGSEKMGGESKMGVSKPKLIFHCQQAHGSPTGLISEFGNVKQLYQKISECYDFNVDDILFCTLNTHRVDMDCLLSAQLCLDDFIFVHRKGTKKEVEVTKTEEALGLTITDNGTGYAFIKRIKEGSVIDTIKAIQVGDHIEKIGDTSLVGWRHVDVAKYLKEIQVGETFTLRLISPLQAGFSNIGPKSTKNGIKSKSYGSGKETLRFKSNGTASIEQAPDDYTQEAINQINKLLENFMGINDSDLASQIWDLASTNTNTMDLAEAIDSSDLESFGFTDDFIIEIWGIVSDAKAGRLTKSRLQEPEEDDDEDLSYLMRGKKYTNNNNNNNARVKS